MIVNHIVVYNWVGECHLVLRFIFSYNGEISDSTKLNTAFQAFTKDEIDKYIKSVATMNID